MFFLLRRGSLDSVGGGFAAVLQMARRRNRLGSYTGLGGMPSPTVPTRVTSHFVAQF